MMVNNEDKAKKLFIEFSCSKARMYRDGVLKIYEQYGISEQLEKEWVTEYINRLFEEVRSKSFIDVEFHKFLTLANNDEHYDVILTFDAYINSQLENYDTYSKILILGSLLDIKKNSRNSRMFGIIQTLSESVRESIVGEQSHMINPAYRELKIIPLSQNESTLRERIEGLLQRMDKLE